MKESNYTYKDMTDVKRLLLKKAISISEINRVGNLIFKLKNERLRWQQDAAGAEKQLMEITIKNNKLDFIRKNEEEKS